MANDKRSTINIRLGESLLQELRVRAAHNAQSMNAEIVQRLATSVGAAATGLSRNTANLSMDESSLVRLWRTMRGNERSALLAVVELFAEKAQSDRTQMPEQRHNGLVAANTRGKAGAQKILLSDAQISEAIIRMQAGEKANAVAEDLGVTRQAIYKRAKRMLEKQE